MDDDNTAWQPIEPTMPEQKRPYEPTAQGAYPSSFGNPYEDAIPIPPPPPRKPRRYLGVLLVIAILLFSAAGLFAWTYTYHVGTTQPTPIVRFVPVTPTAPAVTPAPTIHANYNASDVMADFLHAGMPVTDSVSGNTIWAWSGDSFYISHHAVSSVQWDDSATAPCGQYNYFGLWVYQDAGTAAQVYTEVQGDERTTTMLDPEYQHGRCVLIGQNTISPYWQLVQQYCI